MKERPILFSGRLVRAILDGRKTQTRRLMRVQPEVVKDWSRKGVDGLRWPWATYREGYFDGVPACGPLPPEMAKQCPYGAPGDRLWVREAWRSGKAIDDWNAKKIAAEAIDAGYRKPWAPVRYEADGMTDNEDALRFSFGGAWGRYRHARFMPRWASRLTLEVTGVRVERLQAITEADAIAEGSIAQVGDGGGPGAGYKWTGIGYQGATAGSFHVPDADGRCRCKAAGPGPARCAFAELWDTINGDRASWESNPWVWVVEFRRVEAVR